MTIEAKIHAQRPGFDLQADLSFDAVGVLGVFGRSGSGKSTILRAIAGLDRHPNTTVRVAGETWQDSDTFVSPHRRSVGFVFQDASLFPHLSVKKNVEYGFKRSSDPESAQVEASFDLLGIGSLMERGVASLSGGEKQRVAIARALAMSPRLILMDEPLSSLDDQGKQEILPYIASLRETLEIPMLYVTHDLDEIARIADEIVLLKDGRITAKEPVSRFITDIERGDAEAVVDAIVDSVDNNFDLTLLRFDGSILVVPGKSAGIGSRVRVLIDASNVSITLERQTGTSIQNILECTVDAISKDQDGQVLVRLICGDTPIVSRITKKSHSELGLKKGKQVFAQIKSVVLLD